MTETGRVLIAADKFKGSLTATEVAARVTAGIHRVRPDADVAALPVADGGDGTVDAAVAAGVKHIAYTSSVGIDPKNPAIVIRDHTATEEMLRASGVAWTFLRDNHYAEAVATAIAVTSAIGAAR